jgi:hypothetical protein
MARELNTSINSTLIHSKRKESSDSNTVIDSTLLPITTYDNVMNRPKVVTSIGSMVGAPFAFLASETVVLSDEEISELCRFSPTP